MPRVRVAPVHQYDVKSAYSAKILKVEFSNFSQPSDRIETLCNWVETYLRPLQPIDHRKQWVHQTLAI